jgi:argonaute-like protein implicated in RNA metabolism and viral defense
VIDKLNQCNNQRRAAMNTRTKKTAKGLINMLTRKGGIPADDKLATLAMSTDRDVTDVASEDLGDFIKQTVRSGYTCVVYPAGDRIMLSVH